MYQLFSGNRNITLADEKIATKSDAILAASNIVMGECEPQRKLRQLDKPPRAIRIVGAKGSAKNAKAVTVVAIGHKRSAVEVRQAA